MNNEFRNDLRSRLKTGWTKRSLRGAALTFAALTIPGMAATSAQAATCLINSAADNGPGTLRDAIVNQSCDTINFALSGAITITSGPLLVSRNVAIVGPGAGALTVQRESSLSYVFPVFKFATAQISTLSGLTIANGFVYVDNGGGIENRGTLTVSNALFSNNRASAGGAFSNYGTMTVNNSVMTQNRSSGAVSNFGTLTMNFSTINDNVCEYGGAIENGGTLFLNNSTLSNNYGAEEGGGIRNFANITVTNSTIFNNSVASGGGAIANYGIATIRNTTIYRNSASYGQIDNSATVNLYNSIVTGGVGTDLPYMDFHGNPPVGEYNIIGGASGGILSGTNLVGVDPLLGPLQNNGGLPLRCPC